MTTQHDMFVLPSVVSENGTLTEELVLSWREKGYALVDGLISKDLLKKCQEEALSIIGEVNLDTFGSAGKLEFPILNQKASNEIPIHPTLINAAAQLLGIDPYEVRLIQSDIWPKWGSSSSVSDQSHSDQRMHCDYGNNTLVHPPDWYEPECVAMIIYLSSGDAGGSTAVAPRNGKDDPAYQWPLIAMPGYGGIPFKNDRSSVEVYMEKNHPEYYKFRQQLYEREVKVNYNFGSILFYRHDVWHRGTPVNENKLRIVCNLGYRKQSATWITTWNCGWAKNMYYGTVEQIIGRSDLLQRSVLGFPPVSSSYWTHQTISAVNSRYSFYGFDPKPYYDALKAREKSAESAKCILVNNIP